MTPARVIIRDARRTAAGRGLTCSVLRPVSSILGLWLAGCAMAPVPPATLDVGQSLERYDARSLQDEALKRFLVENLGRDPSPAWDFEALCWVAFHNHPSLALARSQWATAQAAERVAGVPPNPTLTLTPGYNTTREAGVSPWMPGVNLDFLFVHAFKGDRQLEMAHHETEVARLGVAIAAWNIRSELRKALLETAGAAQREAVLRRQAGLQQRLLTLLEQRFALGAIAAPEVSLARSATLRAESAASNAATEAAVDRARVAAALGLPAAALEGVALPAPPVTAPLSAEAFAAARREALRSRSDIVAALAKYQATHAALALEIANRIPDLHLGPGYQWDQGSNKWTLALSFELPVFHRNEAGIAAALARRAEAAAQFEVVQAQAIAAIDIAVAAQRAAAAQRERATRLRAELIRQNSLVEQRLAAGGADQVEVQTAQLDLASVEAALVDADQAVAAASGALEDALQLPFPHLASLK
jgi:cobalt-zinc-cadmium efflux system outer membrane protein